MNLKEYFAQPVLNRMTQVELSERLNELGYKCSQPMIYQMLKGIRPVPIRLAKGLHQATRGVINKKELHPDIF